jgi:hypothetical protein
MADPTPDPKRGPLIVSVDAGTLLVVIVVVLLVPLLLTGFFAQ